MFFNNFKSFVKNTSGRFVFCTLFVKTVLWLVVRMDSSWKSRFSTLLSPLHLNRNPSKKWEIMRCICSPKLSDKTKHMKVTSTNFELKPTIFYYVILKKTKPWIFTRNENAYCSKWWKFEVLLCFDTSTESCPYQYLLKTSNWKM